MNQPENSTGSKSVELHKPGSRSLNDIVIDLSKELPRSMLETRDQGGSKITFIPWHQATRQLDRYAPGWTCEVVRENVFTAKKKNVEVQYIALTVRLSIPTLEGVVHREQTGFEELVLGTFGDPHSNAMSMAFRRAAAMFGLARYLYSKEKK